MVQGDIISVDSTILLIRYDYILWEFTPHIVETASLPENSLSKYHTWLAVGTKIRQFYYNSV